MCEYCIVHVTVEQPLHHTNLIIMSPQNERTTWNTECVLELEVMQPAMESIDTACK